MNHVFHIVVKTLCRLDFGSCFHTLATFTHTDGHLSWVCIPARQEEAGGALSTSEVLLFPCTGLLVVASLFSLSINLSEIFSNLPKELECVLPTNGVAVDILTSLTDGRHGSLNGQVHVLRLPKK